MPTTCTAGTWTAVGSNTNDPLLLESAHFAVYAPTGTVTNTQAQAALDALEKTVGPTFMGPPIFFPQPYCEGGQTISGTGQIWGDIELRDQGTNVAIGVYYGFVDGAALTANPSQGGDRKAPSPEVTTPPPYAWRP